MPPVYELVLTNSPYGVLVIMYWWIFLHHYAYGISFIIGFGIITLERIFQSFLVMFLKGFSKKNVFFFFQNEASICKVFMVFKSKKYFILAIILEMYLKTFFYKLIIIGFKKMILKNLLKSVWFWNYGFGNSCGYDLIYLQLF